MELIKRYLYAIGRKLSFQQRNDIEKELESAIYDSLTAKYGEKEPTEDEVASVLKEFGSPSKVAANYSNNGNVLIGPKIYPLYVLLLKIVLGAVFLGLTVSFFVGAVSDSSNIPSKILPYFGSLYSAGLSALGMITLIFAMIERYSPDINMEGFLEEEKVWDPKKLPPLPKDTTKVSIAEPIAGIIFTVIALVMVNLFPQIFGIYYFEAGKTIFTPFLNMEAFNAYLPFWNLFLGLSLIKEVLVLKDGCRKWSTSLLDLFIDACNIGVLVYMIQGPVLISQNSVFSEPNLTIIFQKLNQYYDTFLTVILVLSILGIIVKAGKLVYGYALKNK